MHDPGEEEPKTADGFVEYFAIGKREVCVPTHLYKIVVAPKKGGGGFESMAFVMTNEMYDATDELDDYLTTVDWIEERTGLDFMPDLSTADEKTLESTAAKKIRPVPK